MHGFLLKKPTSGKANYHITSRTTDSVSWLPTSLCHLPCSWYCSLPQPPSCLPSKSSHRVGWIFGWPMEHTVTATRAGWQLTQRWWFCRSACSISCIRPQSLSRGGNFWRRHMFNYKQLRVVCMQPPEHISHRPMSGQSRSHQRGGDLSVLCLPEQWLPLISSEAPCEPAVEGDEVHLLLISSMAVCW